MGKGDLPLCICLIEECKVRLNDWKRDYLIGCARERGYDDVVKYLKTIKWKRTSIPSDHTTIEFDAPYDFHDAAVTACICLCCCAFLVFGIFFLCEIFTPHLAINLNVGII